MERPEIGRELRSATPEEIVADWTQFTGGPPVMGVLAEYGPGDVHSLLFKSRSREGLVCFATAGEKGEVVSLHCSPQRTGLGSILLGAAEDRLRVAGASAAVLATTNDNIDAARFYLREGYRLVFVEIDAMERVRARKPDVPLTGVGGVPLRDMWGFEKRL